jgi:hypothetical protein
VQQGPSVHPGEGSRRVRFGAARPDELPLPGRGEGMLPVDTPPLTHCSGGSVLPDLTPVFYLADEVLPLFSYV